MLKRNLFGGALPKAAGRSEAAMPALETLEPRLMLAEGILVAIEGRVCDDETGLSLAGINVDVLAGPQVNYAGNEAWNLVSTVTTDASGLYQVPSLPDRHYRLHVEVGQPTDTEGPRYVEADIFDLAVTGGATMYGMDFSLHRAGSIVGYVYDSAEQPLQGIEVLVEASYTQDGNDWHTSYTDQTGRYEILLLATDMEVYAVKIGYAVSAGVPYAQQIAPGLYAAPVMGAPGPDFRLEQGGFIQGLVQTDDGQPVAVAYGILRPHTMIDNGLLEDPGVGTDEVGQFSLAVPAGQDIYLATQTTNWDHVEINGQHYAWGERWLGPFNVGPGQTVAIPTLVMPKAAALSGAVTDPLGNPVSGAQIDAIGYDVFGGSTWLDEGIFTDELGRYSIECLPAGRFSLAASAGGYLKWQSGEELTLAGGEAAVVDFTMIPADQGAVVSGSILNFGQAAPTNSAGVHLPYQIVDYDDLELVEEVGVIAYDPHQPWTVESLLIPDKWFTGSTDVEDSYGDYFLPLEGAPGSYELLVPTGDQAIVAHRSGLSGTGGWHANLSDPIVIPLAAGQPYGGQDLLIPMGGGSVAGTLFFPADHAGNVGESSVCIFLRQVGAPAEHLGRAVASPGPSGQYEISDLPAAGDYCVYAVADGLMPFVSKPFALQDGQTVNVDIYFDYPPDLTFAAPAQTVIQTEIGSAVFTPFALINLGAAYGGPSDVRIYLSSDEFVDANDTVLPLLPPGQPYSSESFVLAPSNPGTYYIAALADPDNVVLETNEANNWSATVVLELFDPSANKVFAFASYFPLDEGFYRTYLASQIGPNNNRTVSVVRSLVLPAPDGSPPGYTHEVRKYYDGRHVNSTYYGMDQTGLTLYGQGYQAGGRWGRSEFALPFLMCPANLSAGMSVVQTAPWSGVTESGGTWSGTYRQQLDVLGIEEVLVPGGAFDALKVRFQVSATQVGNRLNVTINDDYTTWLVEGLGVVKQQGLLSETVAGRRLVWQFDHAMASVGVGAQPVGDLVGRFDDRFVPPGLLVPGQRVRVPVIVQNLGSERVVGQMAVEVYASRDQFLDESDVLLGRAANVWVNLAPDRSSRLNVNSLVGDDLDEGEYFFLAQVDADGQIEESFEDNNVAYTNLAGQCLHSFGNVGGRRNVVLKLSDPLGTQVTFSLAGAGYGEVVRDEGGNLNVTFYETDDHSRASFSTSRGANGIVNDISVVVTEDGLGDPVGGSLGSLSASWMDLTGDILVTGYLGQLYLDDVVRLGGAGLLPGDLASNQTILIGPAAGVNAAVTFTFGSVGDLNIETATPIRRLVAAEWLDTESEGDTQGERDRIVAPWLDTLQIRGDRRAGIIGHFGADLWLSVPFDDVGRLTDRLIAAEIPNSRGNMPTLGSARISGDLYGARWNIRGSMRDLSVRGIVEETTVRCTDSMLRITIGAAVKSDFLAGVASGVARHAASVEDFINPSAKMQTVIITGLKLPGVEEDPFFFENSNFSAGTIGGVRLLNLLPEAPVGAPEFGFFALDQAYGGGGIGWINYRDSVTGERWIWRPADGELDILDFTARVLGSTGVPA